jgi:hypothetical protein
MWVLSFLFFFRILQQIIFLGWTVCPMPTLSSPGTSMCLCQSFLPQLTSLHFKASQTHSPRLHDLAIYTLPRDHGMDMHA